MRTTVEINDALFRELKRLAAGRGTTLRQVMEEALRLYVKRSGAHAGSYRLQWRTERGRLCRDVDLDDRVRLFELMEARAGRD